ncbi:IS982 family transposase, partial [Klebsiella pneumoniae]|uniref:IS982 family transposase n=1 Tax=Klebsiella pneumoniae TaxID=573 RepID=UPI0027314F91
ILILPFLGNLLSSHVPQPVSYFWKTLQQNRCKCHALVSESGYVIDYTITPASMADSSMTEEVLSQFGTPTVLGDMGYLGQSLHERLELEGIDLITPVRKNMKQKKILFPNFSKRRKVIERVFSFLTNLGAERCKSRSPQGFQLKLEMILLAYSLLLKSAKSLEPETLRYSIGYQVMSKY